MNDTRYIVDDQEVELLPDTLIEVTIKSLEIGDITKRFVNQTSSFKIPLTKSNQAIYGLSNLRQSKSKVPYQNRPVKLLLSGREIISDGYEKIVDTEGQIKTSVYDNGFTFYEAIKDKMIYELDLSLFNIVWNENTIENYRNTTSGVVAPIIDYGDFNGTILRVDTALPSFYYKDIILQIYEDAGYTVSGSILSSDRFTKLIVPFGRDNFRYNNDFTDPLKFNGYKIFDEFIPINVIPSYTAIGFVRKINGVETLLSKAYIYDDEGNILNYVVTSSFTATINFNSAGLFYFQIIYTRGGTSIKVSEVKCNPSANGYASLSIDAIIMNPGDYVEFAISGNGFPMFVNDIKITSESNGSLYSSTIVTSNISIANLLPDISQSDLIKDFYVTFGLIPYEKDKKIVLKSINEVIADVANSFSITRFRSNERPKTSFEPSIYGLNNFLKYAIPTEIEGETLGQGLFTLVNYELLSDKTIFTTFFNASKTRLVKNINCAYVPVFKGEIAIINIVSGGSGFTNGTFNGVAITGSPYGKKATANIVVSGGAITQITIANSGEGYRGGENIGLLGYGTFAGTVVIPDTKYNFYSEPKIRKLMVRAKRASESNVIYNATSYSDYLVAYFVDPLETNDCSFQKSIDNDYSLLVSSLQLSRVESQTYFLNAVHLNKFTPHTLLFDRDSYFLLNSLKFTNGFLSKLELFKIG